MAAEDVGVSHTTWNFEGYEGYWILRNLPGSRDSHVIFSKPPLWHGRALSGIPRARECDGCMWKMLVFPTLHELSSSWVWVSWVTKGWKVQTTPWPNENERQTPYKREASWWVKVQLPNSNPSHEKRLLPLAWQRRLTRFWLAATATPATPTARAPAPAQLAAPEVSVAWRRWRPVDGWVTGAVGARKAWDAA